VLAEVRADNDDSAGGSEGCPVPASTDACNPGSFFWGVNNVCQRNLTYAAVVQAKLLEFPFVVGNSWSDARFIEVIVEQDALLRGLPVRLELHPVTPLGKPTADGARPGVLVKEGARLTLLAGVKEVGEFWAAPGSIWRPSAEEGNAEEHMLLGAHPEGSGWRLTQPRSIVGIPIAPGQLHVARLRIARPPELRKGQESVIRIWQRNDRRIVTGGVTLVLGADLPARRPARTRAVATNGRRVGSGGRRRGRAQAGR
jgi:hypothetical protein